MLLKDLLITDKNSDMKNNLLYWLEMIGFLILAGKKTRLLFLISESLKNSNKAGKKCKNHL